MARGYASFVLRCWRLDAAERRVTVEHIQSGERGTFPSIAAAVEWICARSDVVAPLPANVPHQTRPSPRDQGAGGAAG